MPTSLKGVASTKLAGDLGISQKSACYQGHCIRSVLAHCQDRLVLGPIEVNQSYIGGKAKNLHASQRDGKRGVSDKYAVVGILDRATGEVCAEAVADTKKDEFRGYLEENSRSDATLYSDEMRSYENLPKSHEAVPHSAGAYVCGGGSSQFH